MPHPTVLFVSERDAVRSQIAEALLRHYGEGRYEVYSTGVDSLRVAPEAFDVLREQGIVVDAPSVRALDQLDAIAFDYVINICDSGDDATPTLRGASETMTWHFNDVATSDDQALVLRRLHDEILSRIRFFILTDRRYL